MKRELVGTSRLKPTDENLYHDGPVTYGCNDLPKPQFDNNSIT
jgi:hypothetical protein